MDEGAYEADEQREVHYFCTDFVKFKKKNHKNSNSNMPKNLYIVTLQPRPRSKYFSD